MEPFKALTFLTAVGIVSLVSAGAAGFYAGYSAGRGNLNEIKAQIAGLSLSGGGGGGSGGAASAVSLKPVLDDLHALAKQVETLAAARPAVAPVAAADTGAGTRAVLEEVKALARQIDGMKLRPAAAEADQGGKPLLEELKLISRQIDALKGHAPQEAEPAQGSRNLIEEIRALARQVEALKARPAVEPDQIAKPVLEEIKTLERQVDNLKNLRPAAEPDQGGGKAVMDEIKGLGRQIEALKLVQPAAGQGQDNGRNVSMAAYTEVLQNVRDQVALLSTKFDKQEPKAPKALLDEIHALGASVQAQEPASRRALAEELRTVVAALQNSEARLPKSVIDELHSIAANTRLDSRPQTSVADQIKVLTATIDALKAKLAEDSGRHAEPGVAGQVAELHQLVAAATDQFGKCQTQLASLSTAGSYAHEQPVQPAATTVSMATLPHQPATVVFYDNIMLKRDQEKQYDEIGVRLSLQSISARQVKMAVNRQGVGLAFGERKVFRSQDVECELNLMETNLNEGAARVSISCKR